MLSLKRACKSAAMKASEIFKHDMMFKKKSSSSLPFDAPPQIPLPTRQRGKKKKRFRPFIDLDKPLSSDGVFFFFFFFQRTKPLLTH